MKISDGLSFGIWLFWALVMIGLPLKSVCGAEFARPLTVADSIQTMRVLRHLESEKQIIFSPSGRRYLLITIQGDLTRNGNWLQFHSGLTNSLDGAVRDNHVANLFTVSTLYSQLHFKQPVWLESEDQIVFLWDDGRNKRQVALLNLSSGHVRLLTDHSTGVQAFGVSTDGDVLAYRSEIGTAYFEPQFAAMRSRGFAVATADLTALLNGWPDEDRKPWFSSDELMIVSRPGSTPRKVTFRGDPRSRSSLETAPPLSVSPDGRWVISYGPFLTLPKSWSQYTEPAIKSVIKELLKNPATRQPLGLLWLINSELETMRPLWDAPYLYPTPLHIAWSADSRRVSLSPAVLPTDRANAPGLAGKASAEIDVISGAWHTSVIPEASPITATTSVQIRLRQSINFPPALVVSEQSTGDERPILDLSPKLRFGLKVGKVELIHWQHAGRSWSGLLYYPVDYSLRRRYPLVVQTHGYQLSADEFSLIGVDWLPVACAAQALANRGIAVLQLGDPDSLYPGLRLSDDDHFQGTPQEAEIYMGATEAVIELLVKKGVVERQKVGLEGFSHTGYHVEYAITHSDFPYGAAIAADHANYGYLQYVIAQYDFMQDEAERMNGGAPFGKGLQAWFEHAPGFNANRVRTPLRLEFEGEQLGHTAALVGWELFSQLRRLGKPVEMFLIPQIGIGQGSHALEHPKQLLASQGGAVDWFDFWLNDAENPDPAKHDQHLRWKKLRAQQRASQQAAPNR